MTNRSAPATTIVPIFVYEDVAEAIVVSHAQLTFGDGAIIIGRQGGPFRAPEPDKVSAYVHITVDDIAAHFAHAQKCGACIVEPPHDMPFGERQYTVQDCGGHRWTFSQHIADVPPEEWGATVPS